MSEQALVTVAEGAGPYSIGSDHWPGVAKLIEECGEVLQIAGKLIATAGQRDHWSGADLWRELSLELGDLCAAITFVIEQNGVLDSIAVEVRHDSKVRLFNDWQQEQR